MATLHYASGGSATEVATAGFNLVDVQSVEQLNELPDGMKGLVWLNEAEGVTSSFIDKVTPFIGNPKLFGFFLVDEPDPTGQWGTYATAADLKAESDYIHANVPGAKTFITTMNMGSSADPDFSNTFNPANTGIDLYGVSAYPVRTGEDTVDYSQIDKAVAAAEEAGIPVGKIVPTYQTFGGGAWMTDTGGKYVMPTAAQLETMLEHWAAAVPSPVFDYAYAWGSQQGDVALESSSQLQAVSREHNLSTTAASDATASDDSSAATVPADAAISDDSSAATVPADAATSDDSSAGIDVPNSDTGVGSSAWNAAFHSSRDGFHAGRDGDMFHAAARADRMADYGGGDKASDGSSVDRMLASVRDALSFGSESELLTATSDKTASTSNGFAQRHGNADVGKGGDAETSGPRSIDAFDFGWLQDRPHFGHSFAELRSGGLSSDAFSAGRAAHDRSDHVTYDSSTGSLSFDGDATGGATQFAAHFPWQHDSL